MAGNVNENKIVIPVLGVIYLASLFIVAIQHFTEASFGFISFLAWIVVIFGSLAFVYHILAGILVGS
jgi:hypothetical protein